MKNKLKNAVAFLLALTLGASLFTVPAFAE